MLSLLCDSTDSKERSPLSRSPNSLRIGCGRKKTFVCLLVGRMVVQRPSNMQVYLGDESEQDNCTCCHTETETADQTFHLTQSQCTDTRPTSPSTDHITPGAWQGSHWSANCYVTQKIHCQSDNQTKVSPTGGRCLITTPARRQE